MPRSAVAMRNRTHAQRSVQSPLGTAPMGRRSRGRLIGPLIRRRILALRHRQCCRPTRACPDPAPRPWKSTLIRSTPVARGRLDMRAARASDLKASRVRVRPETHHPSAPFTAAPCARASAKMAMPTTRLYARASHESVDPSQWSAASPNQLSSGPAEPGPNPPPAGFEYDGCLFRP